MSLNNISECARWGIAIRSNGKAASQFNLVEANRVVRTGLTTADFGAISLIDHGGGTAQGNVVSLAVAVDTTHACHTPWHEWVGFLGAIVFARARAHAHAPRGSARRA